MARQHGARREARRLGAELTQARAEMCAVERSTQARLAEAERAYQGMCQPHYRFGVERCESPGRYEVRIQVDDKMLSEFQRTPEYMARIIAAQLTRHLQVAAYRNESIPMHPWDETARLW